MNLKKIISVALCCPMVLGLAACGSTSSSQSAAGSASGSEAAPASTDLVVAWWGSQSRNEKFQAALDLYAEQNPGIAIESQISSFNDHLVALSAAAASNDMPDMAMLQGAYYQQYVDSGLLVDLTPYVESGALDLSNVSEEILAATTIDGKLYGVCAGMNSPCTIYNKTLLDEAGITIEDNMNFQEFGDKCAEIYEKTGYKTYLNNSTEMIDMLLRANGKMLYETDKLGADSAEELQPYFELLERGNEEGWLLDYSLVVGMDATEEQPIVHGTTPETSSWCSFFFSNQADAMQQAAPEGMELELTTYPVEDAKKSNYLREAMSWTISTQSENIDEAVALLNWWINSSDANELIMAEPGVPANTEVAKAIEPNLSDIQKKIFAYINDVITPNCSAANPPAGAGSGEVTSLIEDLNEKVYYGEISAEEAAQTLFEQGNEIMAQAAA